MRLHAGLRLSPRVTVNTIIVENTGAKVGVCSQMVISWAGPSKNSLFRFSPALLSGASIE